MFKLLATDWTERSLIKQHFEKEKSIEKLGRKGERRKGEGRKGERRKRGREMKEARKEKESGRERKWRMELEKESGERRKEK